MTAEHEDQRQLVLRAMAGERLALEELLLANYERLAKHVSRRIPANLARSVSVEDVLQQSYAKAFAAVRRFQPRSEHSFYAWLRTIAENQLIDLCKKRGREPTAAASQADVRQSGAGDLLERLAAEGLAPTDGAMREEAFRLLHVAVGGLPDEYRQVIELHDLQGQDWETVAQTMAKTVDAARSLRHRALKRLQSELVRLSRLM